MSDNFKNSCPFPVQNELEIFFLQGCSCIADIAVTCRPARVCARAPFPGKGRVSPFDFDLSYEAQQENTLWLRLDGCPIGPRLTAGTHLNTILLLLLFIIFYPFLPQLRQHWKIYCPTRSYRWRMDIFQSHSWFRYQLHYGMVNNNTFHQLWLLRSWQKMHWCPNPVA